MLCAVAATDDIFYSEGSSCLGAACPAAVVVYLLACSLPQKNMLIKLKQDFITARKPWEAYKTMGEHNLTLVDLVAGHLGFTEEEANAKLMTRIPASRRRNSRASSTIVAYRYLGRAVSHFHENLGKAAVKGFISSINDSTGMGRQVLVTGSRNRTVLTLTREEAIHLLSGDRYISEGFGKKALLVA